MNLVIKHGYDPEWLNAAVDIYNKTEMKRTDRTKVDRAFQKSFSIVTCWLGDRLVGLGRTVSDGEMYAGIFDVVVDPELQRQGIGKAIVQALIASVPDMMIWLTSTLGNEIFYYKLGFRRHKTGMALYPERARERAKQLYLIEEKL